MFSYGKYCNAGGGDYCCSKSRKKGVQGRYEAEIALRDVGTFELTAKTDDPAYKGLVAGRTITVAVPARERRTPEADEQRLRLIGRGERFMMIQDADRLKEAIGSGKLSLFDDVRRDLWDVPLTLVVIVGLLAVEWIMRKRHNMT